MHILSILPMRQGKPQRTCRLRKAILRKAVTVDIPPAVIGCAMMTVGRCIWIPSVAEAAFKVEAAAEDRPPAFARRCGSMRRMWINF